jgi:ribosomal protein L37E
MVEGFVPDTSYAALVGSAWVEGKAEKNFLGSLKVKGTRTFPIVTFRCSACGFLESYARVQ